jgi:hypothetical protein
MVILANVKITSFPMYIEKAQQHTVGIDALLCFKLEMVKS